MSGEDNLKVPNEIPTYKTESVGPEKVGLTGAANVLSFGSYPVTSGAFSTTTSSFAFGSGLPLSFSAPIASDSGWILPPTTFSSDVLSPSPIFGTSYLPPLGTLALPPATSVVTSTSGWQLPPTTSFATSSLYPTTTYSAPAPPVYPTVLPFGTTSQVPYCASCEPVAITTQHVVMTPQVETRVEYVSPCAFQQQVHYIQSPPEIRYIQSPPEIRYIEAPQPPAPEPVVVQDPALLERIRELEGILAEFEAKGLHWAALERGYLERIAALEEELNALRLRLETAAQQRSITNVTETYKVKTFEMAAKLAVMDGTDDGLYNGLPIEVEGEGLYRDLVAQGRTAKFSQESTSASGKVSSVTTSKETYKVKTFEMAEKLSVMDGTDDGLYNGLPIEVIGEGMYLELKRAGRTAKTETSSTTRTSSGAKETYKVSSFELAEKLSKMDGTDDGLYNGIPIEVSGQGLYTELVKARRGLGNL